MDTNLNTKIIKVERMDNSQVEMNIEENIVIDDNTEILTINNDSNIQLEFFDVKNIAQNNVALLKSPNNIEEENKNLKKELTLTQEKFSILQSQVQHQSKLIELLLRLDMIKSDDDPDKREMEDLQRKIQLCSNLIEECNIKFSELCNERRRVLIVNNSEPASSKIEKRAAVWDHFTVLASTDGQKNAECNYCGKCFNYRNMNANKCREHINEKCEKAPEAIKSAHRPRYDSPSNKSKYTVWNYFVNSDKDGKAIIVCMYCGIEYSSRNATKCREHLAFKCVKIPEEIKTQMRSTFSQEYIQTFNTNKRSTIWEHFSIIEDEDKTVIQCIYCCMNYANKNATKCREHLLERCDKIPLNIRHKINNSFYESPLKTWTQIKIPIWKHFSVVNHKDRKQFKCNYCKKIYSSKNVTKFRLHLLYKCEQIPENIKSCINAEVTKSSMKSGVDNVDNEAFFDESHYSNENDSQHVDVSMLNDSKNESQNIDDSNDHSMNDDDDNDGHDSQDRIDENEIRLKRMKREINDDGESN